MSRIAVTFLLIAIITSLDLAQTSKTTTGDNDDTEDIYVDNFTHDLLQHFTVDAHRGVLTPAETINLQPGIPFALTLATVHHSTARFLYVLDLSSSTISDISLDSQTGAATFASKSSSMGALPDAMAVTRAGNFLYVANVNYNTVAGFSIDATTGALTPVPGSPFPTGQMPASVAITPHGRFLYVSNLLANSISAYSIDRHTGALLHLQDVAVKGQNPGALAMDPDGDSLYVVNIGSGSMSAFSIRRHGGLTEMAGSPFPTGITPLHMAMHPAGRFIYAADVSTGTIYLWHVNRHTGELHSSSVQVSGINPNAMAMDPSGRFLYVVNTSNTGGVPTGDVSTYDVNPYSGTLTFIAKVMFDGNPDSLVIAHRQNCEREEADDHDDR